MIMRSCTNSDSSRPATQIINRGPVVAFSGGGWGTQNKRSYGDVPPTWVAKSAFWYMNDPK